MAKGFNQNQDPMQKLQEGFGKLSSEVSNLYSMFSHLRDAIGQLDRLATRVTFQMFAMAGMNNPIPYGMRDLIAKGGFNSSKGNKSYSAYGNSGGGSGGSGPNKPGPGSPSKGPNGEALVPYDDEFLKKVSADLRRQAAASVLKPGPNYVDKQLLEPIPFQEHEYARTMPTDSSIQMGKSFEAGGALPALKSDEKKLLSQASLSTFRSNIMEDIKEYRNILKRDIPKDKVSQALIANLRRQLTSVARQLPLSVVENLGASISAIEKAVGSFGKNTSAKTRTSAFHSAQKALFDNIKAGKNVDFSISPTELPAATKDQQSANVKRARYLQRRFLIPLGLQQYQANKTFGIGNESTIEGWSNKTSMGNVEGIHGSLKGKDLSRVAFHELFHTLHRQGGSKTLKDKLGTEGISQRLYRKFSGASSDTPTSEIMAQQFGDIQSKGVWKQLGKSFFQDFFSNDNKFQNFGKSLANAFALNLRGRNIAKTLGLQGPSTARRMWNGFKNINVDEEGRPITKPGSVAAMNWHEGVQHKLGVPFLAGAAGITGLLKASSPDAMHTLIDTGSIAAAKVGRGFIPPAMKMAKGVNDFGNWFDRRSDTTKSAIGWGAAGTVGAMGLVLVFAKLSRAAQQAAMALASIRAKAGALGGGPGLTAGKGALIGGGIGALIGTAFGSGLSEDISKGLGLKSQASNDAVGLGLLAATTGAGGLIGSGLTKGFNKISAKLPSTSSGAWPKGMNPTAVNASRGAGLAKGLGTAAKVGGPATAIAALAMYGIDHVTDITAMAQGKRVQQNNLTTLPTLLTPLNVLNNAGREKIEGPKVEELPIGHPDRRFAAENEDSGYAGRVRKETIKTGVDIAGSIYDRTTQNIPERLALKIRKQFLTDEEAAEQDKMPSIGSMIRNAIGIGERGVGLNPSFNPDKFEKTPGERKEIQEKINKAKEEGKKLQNELKLSLDSVRVEPQFMGIEDVWKTAQLSMLTAPNEQEKIEQAIIGLGVVLEEIAKNTAQVTELEPMLKP